MSEVEYKLVAWFLGVFALCFVILRVLGAIGNTDRITEQFEAYQRRANYKGTNGLYARIEENRRLASNYAHKFLFAFGLLICAGTSFAIRYKLNH